MAEKLPKYKVTIARGFNGIEQDTIELTTDNRSELRELVNAGADAFADRNEYYISEQKKFDTILAEKQAEVDATVEADEQE